MGSGKMKGRRGPGDLDPGGLVSVCLKTTGTQICLFLLQLTGFVGYREREGGWHYIGSKRAIHTK